MDRRADRRVAADRAAGRARPGRRRARPAGAPRPRRRKLAAAKIVAHWLTFGPLLLIAAVPAAVLLGMRRTALGRAAGRLAVGTPALAALAVAVAALTAGLPRAGSLAGLLLLPLAVPLLIFGAAATAIESGALLLEAAVSLLLTAGAPFVAGAAIRASRT